MEILVGGLILFLGIHSVPIISEAWRNQMVERFGKNSWQGIHSLVAIVGFLLIVWGYGVARQDPIVLYAPPFWLRHVSMLLLIFVFPLLIATYLPGHIKAATKHPMLVATKIWAIAHLLANGMLHDVLLFGAFLAWAVVDRISMRNRIQQAVAASQASKLNDVIAVVAGLALYVAFVLKLHIWLIGVSPIG